MTMLKIHSSLDQLQQLPVWVKRLTGIILMMLAILFDAFVVPTIQLGFIYSLPVIFVSWVDKRNYAFGFSIVLVLFSFIFEEFLHRGAILDPLTYVNVIFRLTLLLIITAAFDALKLRESTLQKRIHERTKELSEELEKRRRAEEALRRAEERFFSAWTDLHLGVDELMNDNKNERGPVALGDLAGSIDEVTEKMRRGMRQIVWFSTLVSHEMKSPLAVIRAQLEDLLHVKDQRADFGRSLVSVYDNILRMGQTVNDLLNIARLQSHRFKLRLEEINLGEFLNDLYEEAILLSREKQISIVLAEGSPVLLSGDRQLLRQAFFNILDNAIRHTPHGGRIRIRYEAGDGTVQISFSDTGVGFASSQNEKQSHKEDATRVWGTGLGLALCNLIAASHGGSLSIKSSPTGSTVSITLPLKHLERESNKGELAPSAVQP